ncbi:MAG: DNRLRE domain-containing protein, partial [Chloroflexota bacterium]
AIAISPNNDPHVVWVDNSAGNWEIFYTARIAGNPWQAYVNVSNSIGGSDYPDVAFDTVGAMHVAWYDYTTGNNEVLYTYRSPGGNWMGQENVSGNASGSTNPSLAVDPLGFLHVAWQDDDPGRLDIYYAKHLGSLVTPTPTVEPTTTETPWSTPTETPTETPTLTPSVSPTATFTATPTATETPSPTPTPTITLTPTPRSYRITLKQGVDDYTGTTDTWINSWLSDGNYGDRKDIAVRASDVQASLVRFDLSDAFVSPNVDVHLAVLSLYALKHSNDNPLQVSAHQVLLRWEEMEATWDESEDGVPWFAPGCNKGGQDRVLQTLSTVPVTHLNDYFHFNITDAVHAWAQNPESNFGVVFKTNPQVQVRYDFASSEHLTTAKHPQLNIVYSVRYATQTPPPTYTPQPTYTSEPTHTPQETYTPLPTFTGLPTYTPGPTYTPRPTYTPGPTYTPRPTYTLDPSITPTVTNTPTYMYLPIISK